MIHSSVESNWMRVEIMHSIAENYHLLSCEEENREKGNDLFFNCKQYDIDQRESCMVGMIKVWCVVTLESMINHAIAQIIVGKEKATLAIEFPKKFLKEELKLKPRISELSCKIIILNNGLDGIESLVQYADCLSSERNLIIHDKPHEFIQYEDGDFEIEYFATRGLECEVSTKFLSLNNFYQKCDAIKNYAIFKSVIEFSSDFCTLLKVNNAN